MSCWDFSCSQLAFAQASPKLQDEDAKHIGRNVNAGRLRDWIGKDLELGQYEVSVGRLPARSSEGQAGVGQRLQAESRNSAERGERSNCVSGSRRVRSARQDRVVADNRQDRTVGRNGGQRL